MDPPPFESSPGIHLFDVRDAILPACVVPGLYWFRWVDAENQEYVRRAVVIRIGMRLHMHFADEHWVRSAGCVDLPVDLLQDNCGFYVVRPVEGSRHV
jgi:hypothetical protein